MKKNKIMQITGFNNWKKYLIYILLVCAVIFPWILSSGLIIRIGVTALIYALVSMGNMVIVGYCGLLQCGHGAFYGVGAYVSAILATNFGCPFWMCFLAAIIGSMIFGYLISLPCLRVQVDFLSLMTIAFAQIFTTVVTNWKSVTGGPSGIVAIPAPKLFGYEFVSQKSYYYLVLVILILCYCALNNLMKSPIGRAMQAVRDDEIGAKSMGINANRYKILAFILGAATAGIAGSLMAHYLRYIGPTSFSLDVSLLFMQMIILGGLGSLPGAIVGAIFFTVVPEIIRPLAVYRMGLGGAIMLVVVLLRPQGIMGSKAFAGTGGILSKFAWFPKRKKIHT